MIGIEDDMLPARMPGEINLIAVLSRLPSPLEIARRYFGLR
jgi:hypothetical protein